MLNFVQKKCVSRCGWGSCNEICEGCESKKCKISVGARTRTRDKGVFWFICRSLFAVVVIPAWSVGKERVVDLAFISDVWQKTLEIFWKTWEIFRKTLEIFCGKFGAKVQKVVKYCRRSGECAKASVGQRDEIKESFGQVEGKPYFCREQGSVA